MEKLHKLVIEFAKKSYGEELKQRIEFASKIFPQTENSLTIYFSRFLPILEKSDSVLDAGCGRGFFSFSLPAKKILGVDLSSQQITEANKRKIRQDAEYICADILSLPEKNKYNTILSMHCLEHIADPKQLFLHLNHILKPKGKLLILTPSIYSPFYLINKIVPSPILDLIKKLLHLPENRTPTYYFTNTSQIIDKLLIESGFKKVSLFHILDIPITIRSKFYLLIWKFFHKFILFLKLDILLPMIACVYEKN